MWRYWQDTQLPLLEHERFLWLELDLTHGIPVVPANSQLGPVILFILFLYRKWMRMQRMVEIMMTTTDSFSSNTFLSRGKRWKSIFPVETAFFLVQKPSTDSTRQVHRYVNFVAKALQRSSVCRASRPALEELLKQRPYTAVLEAAPAPWNAEDQRNAEVAMIQNGENAVEMWKTNNSYHPSVLWESWPCCVYA